LTGVVAANQQKDPPQRKDGKHVMSRSEVAVAVIGSLSAARELSEPERARMVDFAQRWVHYGGVPEEDIFVEFGITARQFYERLADVTAEHLGA